MTQDKGLARNGHHGLTQKKLAQGTIEMSHLLGFQERESCGNFGCAQV
ncbi:MAG: hypothetical protein NVSMB9_10680 [Isosphaeraceae bacterium]